MSYNQLNSMEMNDHDHIRFTFTSNKGVLGVWCTECGRLCTKYNPLFIKVSYSKYTSPNLYWSGSDKKKLLCSTCAKTVTGVIPFDNQIPASRAIWRGTQLDTFLWARDFRTGKHISPKDIRAQRAQYFDETQ